MNQDESGGSCPTESSKAESGTEWDGWVSGMLGEDGNSLVTRVFLDAHRGALHLIVQ